MAVSIIREEEFTFPPDQRALIPGGPARPPHPRGRRYLYGLIGVLVGITSGLGGALVQANTSYLQGALGASATQIQWIPTVYVMVYVSMNLLLVRFRQQFGLRRYTIIGLTAFCLVTAAHTLVHGVTGAIFIHAVAGFATAPLLALSVFYLMAAMPPGHALRGPVLALSILQVPAPMARLFPTEELALDQWKTLYLFELGLGLLCLSAVAIFRLPPSERSKVFEPLDFVTYPLIAIGMGLLVAVIGLGRYEWWTDRAWLGWAIAAAIPLLTAAAYIEFYRARPLVDLRWLRREHLFRFGLVIIVLRIAAAEQSAIAFGLLNTLGIITTNLRPLSFALFGAAVAGAITAALLFRPDRILMLGAGAFLLIGVSALIDSHTTNLTRAPQLYATQMMISFATSLAVGPSLVFGLTRVVSAGGTPLPSFLVLLSIAQNVGNLIGLSALGTFQIISEKAASVALIGRVQAFDAVVQARISAGGGGEAGVSALQRAMSREANVLAFGNSFALVAVLAAVAAAYLIVEVALARHRISHPRRTPAQRSPG
jgi:hypothetical protein